MWNEQKLRDPLISVDIKREGSFSPTPSTLVKYEASPKYSQLWRLFMPRPNWGVGAVLEKYGWSVNVQNDGKGKTKSVLKHVQ